MIWGGTTAIEAKLLNRNLIWYDINPQAVELSKSLLNFELSWESCENPKIQLYQFDARKKNPKVKDETIDFVLMHPPYADIIKYSDWIKWDLSQIRNIEEFCKEMKKVAKEAFRVLKPWKFCAVLIGDTRRNKMYIPLAFKVMEKFLKVWFVLKEDIIKIQHNCKATWFWVKRSKEYNFLLIMHEHLFVFQKI